MTNSVLPYCFHDTLLLNLSLSKDIYCFCIAIPCWQLDGFNEDDDDNCFVVDVICRNTKINSLIIRDCFEELAGTEVLAFDIDNNGNALLELEYNGYAMIDFKCDTWEVKELGVTTWDEVGVYKDAEEMRKSEWCKLPNYKA